MKYSRLFIVIAFPIALLSLFIATLQTKASPSATFTVNSTVDAVDVNPGDGVCETAVAGQCTLRAAVMEANALAGEDSIKLGSNTYLLTIAGNNEDTAATGDLDITDALMIEGNGSSLTIIDGNQLDRVLEVYWDASLILTGTTVTNGWIDIGLLGSGAGGAGILNSSSLIIENSSIFSNTAHTLSGGGIYNNSGVITITNSAIISNAITGNTGREGVGISNFGGSLFISNSQVNHNLGEFSNGGGIYSFPQTTISNTSVIGNDANNGGGLYLSGSTFIANSTISENISISGSESAGRGGGIYYESALDGVEIINSSIISNTGMDGGGIYLNGVLTITQSNISDNFAYYDGGGILATLSNLTIIDSTIDHNKTFPVGSNFGGAIFATFLEGDILSISQSTINNNEAGTAAGVYLSGGGPHHIQNSTLANNTVLAGSSAVRLSFNELTVENTTIANNVSESSNPDGAIMAGSLVTVTTSNTIIANNLGGNCITYGIVPGLEGTIISNGNNLSSDNSCNFSQPSDMVNVDPSLGLLQDNGGNTNTFALLPSSLAIDAGNNTTCLATDQRGVLRPLDGNGDSVATCDIGAVEMENVTNPQKYIYLPVVVKP